MLDLCGKEANHVGGGGSDGGPKKTAPFGKLVSSSTGYKTNCKQYITGVITVVLMKRRLDQEVLKMLPIQRVHLKCMGSEGNKGSLKAA